METSTAEEEKLGKETEESETEETSDQGEGEVEKSLSEEEEPEPADKREVYVLCNDSFVDVFLLSQINCYNLLL